MTDDEIYRRDSEIINLRAALAEARGSSALNGALCDIGFASLDTWREETIRLRADLAESEDERKAYISRELYITKARDKAEADLAAARGAIEDAIDTLESMNLHIDNPLYDRLRTFLERTATADAIK